ncbi:MAG: hypothetical protein GXP40_12660 [Chloroflexi bacterium]|nr:hypothetical protein [Chloroflexota bacterium]
MPLESALLEALERSGLCGQGDPAQAVLAVVDVEQRLRVLTLGVVLHNNHLSADRWQALCALQDHWLLDATQVAYGASRQVLRAMQDVKLGAARHTARVWWQICRGIQGRFQGSLRDLLQANQDDALRVQAYLTASKTSFPVLSGPVMSARWLDLVHRLGGLPLENWERLGVALSGKQRKQARIFGVEGERVHPFVAAALHTWEFACREGTVDACGFPDCPKRRR